MERELTNKLTRSRLKLLWPAVGLVVASLVGLVYVGFSKMHEQTFESETARETTGTVTQKEHVIFDEKNRSFVNGYNDRIEQPVGTEQWRVYYGINDFNPLPEPLLKRVIQAEENRIADFGPRFTYNSREWYDKIEPGDILEITYRVIGDGEVEVISVTNPKYPTLH